MKITKLVHSCLLIELNDKKILVDPGVYSWKDQAVQSFNYTNVHSVVVTHNHPDHLNIDFAKAVNLASPEAKWYGTHEVVEALSAISIVAIPESSNDDIKYINSEHADLSPWMNKQPEHTSYVLFNELLVSGDCQTLNSMHGARVLAGAINGGPWGAVVGFSKMIELMSDKPEVILPLHDWHWNDEARDAIYEKLPYVMQEFKVTFLPLKNFEQIEI